MKRIFFAITFISVFYGCSKNPGESKLNRQEIFNSDWKFFRGDLKEAQKVDFNDSAWRTIDLPHDYSIEELPQKEGITQIGPFTSESEGGASTGHVKGGTGWYRKHFSLKKTDNNKLVKVLFDGVYMDADLWINGIHLGNHPYGYTAFYYDLTPHLNPAGMENVLAVQVKNAGKNSRWYSGSGIYRNVWLVKTGAVHFKQWGTFITTPEVDPGNATLRIETSVENLSESKGKLSVQAVIMSPGGGEAGKVIQQLDNPQGLITLTMPVQDPQLWEPDSPELYTAILQLMEGNKLLDREDIRFGIRKAEFSPESGLLINGRSVLLKGGCMHHDNGPLGSAAFDAAEYRRVHTMKENGFNAIRTSHNPPSQSFLDACDELGMLVIDEAFDQWQRPKNEMDYNRFFDQWWEKDLEAMVLRDRNHPSVIIWSIGNEINERADSSGLKIAAMLKNKIREMDVTRPVTQAICHFWDHKGRSWEDTAPAFAQMDVHGYNYRWNDYEPDHEKYPERIMIGTESFPLQAFENWQMVEKHPYVIGDFVWTGMDYLGESGIGHTKFEDSGWGFLPPWPWFNSYCGDIGILGYKKPQMYFRDVVWRNSELEMLVHEPVPEGKKEVISQWGWPAEWKSWNWSGNEGKLLQVSVYTRCDQVRLELNGNVIGTSPVSESTGLKTIFQVPYQPGELIAIGLKEGKEFVRQLLKTSGEAAGIKITAEIETVRADRNDLAYLNVEIVDTSGNLVPDAMVEVMFAVEGAGELQAVGNGNPSDMRSFQKPEITTFRGKCQVILRPFQKAGTLKLIAKAEKLSGAMAEIQVR